MNAVGIDISKGKSTVCILSPEEMSSKPFEISHTKSEVKRLIRKLKRLEEVIILMESTGSYGDRLRNSLVQAGFYVCVLNPRELSKINSLNRRSAKTDKEDAERLAKIAMMHRDELRRFEPDEVLREQLKTLNRLRESTIAQKVASKNSTISLLERVFPELNEHLGTIPRKDGSIKWIDFLDTFWHAECVSSSSFKQFSQRYSKWCAKKGYRFEEAKARELYDLASSSLTSLPKDVRTKKIVKLSVSRLKAILKELNRQEEEMLDMAMLMPEYPAVIEMNGVGEITAAQLIAEIGDVRRFANRNAFKAWAGLDPGTYQSGKYEQKNATITHRGSSELRKTLFTIMQSKIKTKPENDPVYEFMMKKKEEGKPYKVYLTAGSSKFLKIYMGTVKKYLQEIGS